MNKSPIGILGYLLKKTGLGLFDSCITIAFFHLISKEDCIKIQRKTRRIAIYHCFILFIMSFFFIQISSREWLPKPSCSSTSVSLPSERNSQLKNKNENKVVI